MELCVQKAAYGCLYNNINDRRTPGHPAKVSLNIKDEWGRRTSPCYERYGRERSNEPKHLASGQVTWSRIASRTVVGRTTQLQAAGQQWWLLSKQSLLRVNSNNKRLNTGRLTKVHQRPEEIRNTVPRSKFKFETRHQMRMRMGMRCEP